MGQKVNPNSMRLQVNKNWKSKWFATRSQYKQYLIEDLKLRQLIEKRFTQKAVINRIDISRSAGSITIDISTPKAGVVIGRGGSGVNELRDELQKACGTKVTLNINEVRKPELESKIVAEEIARQLENRIAFRRAVRGAMGNTMRAGAKGIRIEISGRLNGAEMSRREKEIEGSVPLHTIRSDISYHQATAMTGAGTIGVKVWINRGEEA